MICTRTVLLRIISFPRITSRFLLSYSLFIPASLYHLCLHNIRYSISYIRYYTILHSILFHFQSYWNFVNVISIHLILIFCDVLNSYSSELFCLRLCSHSSSWIIKLQQIITCKIYNYKIIAFLEQFRFPFSSQINKMIR